MAFFRLQTNNEKLLVSFIVIRFSNNIVLFVPNYRYSNNIIYRYFILFYSTIVHK